MDPEETILNEGDSNLDDAGELNEDDEDQDDNGSPDGDADNDDDLNGQDGDEDVIEDEADYVAQFGLPGNPRTIEEAITIAKNSLGNMNQLQRQVNEMRAQLESKKGGTDDPFGAPQPRSILGRNLYSSQIDQLIKKGMIDPDKASGHRIVAQMNDEVMNEVLGKVERMFSSVAGKFHGFEKGYRSSAWNNFAGKKLVERAVLDKLIDERGFEDYDSALRFYAATERPELLSSIVQAEKPKGGSRYKKFGKTAATRGGKKNGGGSSDDYRKYMNSDGSPNEERIFKLPEDRQQTILNKILASVKSK